MRRNLQRYTAHYYTFRRPKALKAQKVHKLARHPFAVPVITLAALLLLTGGLFIFFNRTPGTINPNVVVISYDKQQQIVSSKEPTVGALLTKLKIEVHPGDVVEPAPDTPIRQDDFRINIYRAVPVEIVDQGQRTFAYSARTTERSVASEAGITIYPEDKLTMQPVENFVSSGGITEQVVVDRATPVNVNLYGAPVVMRTHAKTVGALLYERGIKLKPQDQIKPALDTPIEAAGQISLVRNGLSTLTVQEDIAMPTQTITDGSLSYGISAVRQTGTAGKKAVTYQINTQNGVEISRVPIQETVVQPPVAQIVVVGTNLSGIKGDMALAGIAPAEYQYADYIISKESGWCPTKWQGQIGYCPGTYTQLHNVNGPDADGRTFGYGLCQSTPAGKMADSSRGGGPDWATNPVTQLKWCSYYARSRYGSWQAAYNHWLSARNW